MKLDFATLAFGYNVLAGGNTPNWATSLGQSKAKKYRINDDASINELLKGMTYCSVPVTSVSTKIGKGGAEVSGKDEGNPIVSAAVFSNVYINETPIYNGKFILLITRDTSPSHFGRLRIKYGPSNKYTSNGETYSNEAFFTKMRKQLELADDACFFVSEIQVVNQSDLILKTFVVNKYHSVEYPDGVALRQAWGELADFNIELPEDSNEPDVPAKKELPVLSPRNRTRFPLNTILYGAPGTGKTFSTAQYALAIAENKDFSAVEAEDRESVMARYNALVSAGQIVFTTFHQNYSYEDFIQGIRPDTTSGSMSFSTVDGVFKVIADKAMKYPQLDFVIIIDEINRANISKVFGELITLIEDDKRWGEINAIDATLPSGDPFAVPNNLYILGTMNSADKSISLIDTALRRRFDFVEYEPKAQLVADAGLRDVLIKLNKGISDELRSTDLLIGHSYFMNKSIEDLCNIMNRHIIPLLYEYFFDDQKKVEAQIKTATDGYPVVVKAGSVGRIKLVKKDVE